MRKIVEVLRLHFACGLSQRQIARSCRISRPTVNDYVQRAEAAGLQWPLPEGLDEAQLEARLFPVVSKTPTEGRAVLDWAEIHQSLQTKGVTLSLLWQEYKSVTQRGFNTPPSPIGTVPGVGSWMW